MVDRLHLIGLARLWFGFFILRQPLLERLDAFGKIAHQLGNLAAAPEQQKTDRQDQNPVPNAE
jgi:hypothetical protein